MNPLSVRKEFLLALLLAIYCAYDLITSLHTVWGFTTDDAYISWFYARQFVTGNGLLWYSTSAPVEGYSNFLWIMIASLVIKSHLPLVITMKLISCFSLGAGLVFLYRLGRLFFSPLLAMLPVFIWSHYLGLVWWTVSGLETTFYSALALLLIGQCLLAFGYQTIRNDQVEQVNLRHSTKAWVITNIVLLLLCLTRFEGVVWVIPVFLFMLCQLRKQTPTGFAKNSGVVYQWGIITLFCFIVPYAAYFIWRFNYFGHWIPNSYSCKGLVAGQIFVVDFDYLQVISPLIIASLPYFLSHKGCRHVLLWVPSVLYGLMLWKANPVIAHFLRLFLASFALFTVLPVLGVYQFAQYFNKPKVDPKLITALIIIFITVLFVQGNDLQFFKTSVAHYQERTQSRLVISKILNAQAKKGATILLGDCGIIPFNTRDDIRFIDAQCLNNSELTQIPYNNNLRLYADHLYAQVKPDWVIVNYYPLEHRGELLMDLLKKKHFFDDYQLIDTIKSGAILKDSLGNSNEIIDYIYRIYKRNNA